jgi:hypothetical protein
MMGIPKTLGRMLLLVAMSSMLVSCGISGSAQPTQTPVYIVVPVDTPQAGDAGGGSEAGAYPTPTTCRAEVVEQTYQNGRMFWVGGTLEERCKAEHDFAPGSGKIWVLILHENGYEGDWLSFDDDWDEDTDAPYDITLDVPEGLIQPVRGFGKVWREKLTDEQRDALGWATQNEFKFVTDYRYESGGFVDAQGEFVARPGLHMLVTLGGDRVFLDEPSQTFDLVPADSSSGGE